MATIAQLEKRLSKFDCRIYRIIDNDGIMIQIADDREDYLLNLWNCGWYPTEQDAISATIQHLKECEQMDIFQTSLFKYLKGVMIKDAPVVYTIKHVDIQEVQNQNKTENKPIIHFEETDKLYIPNMTEATKIVVLFDSRNTDDWIGKKVKLYAEFGKWFGKENWAIRVSPEPQKQTIDRFAVGDEVMVSGKGDEKLGTVVSVNGKLVRVDVDGKEINVKPERLAHIEPTADQQPTNSRPTADQQRAIRRAQRRRV